MTQWFDRIRELRLVAGVSCRELDRLAGTTCGYCWTIEHGTRKDVGGTILIRYCGALGCSIEWLLKGTGKRPTDKMVRRSVAKAKTVADSRAA